MHILLQIYNIVLSGVDAPNVNVMEVRRLHVFISECQVRSIVDAHQFTKYPAITGPLAAGVGSMLMSRRKT